MCIENIRLAVRDILKEELCHHGFGVYYWYNQIRVTHNNFLAYIEFIDGYMVAFVDNYSQQECISMSSRIELADQNCFKTLATLILNWHIGS